MKGAAKMANETMEEYGRFLLQPFTLRFAPNGTISTISIMIVPALIARTAMCAIMVLFA